MEYFDVVDENGLPTGQIVSREQAHREAIPHRTAHVWIVREKDGRTQVLLQKRSQNKDAFPGMYDTSSAGHIPAGEEPLASALRELGEELGIKAEPEELTYIGSIRIRFDAVFHGKPFRDNEYSRVYLYREPVEIETLHLQESEVESAAWFDLEDLAARAEKETDVFCMDPASLRLLCGHLSQNKR